MPFGGMLTLGLIGGGTSLLSGWLGSRAAKDAARMQAEAARRAGQLGERAGWEAGDIVRQAREGAVKDVWDATDRSNAVISDSTGEANELLRGIYGDQITQLLPYLQAGEEGVRSLREMLAPGGKLAQEFAFDSSKLPEDPSYQFRLQEGQKALERSAAARGGALGGGAMKSLARYSQGVASEEFQNAYDRALKTFQTNRDATVKGLEMLTGLGEKALGHFNDAASNYGNQASRNLTVSGIAQAGNTRDAGYFAGNSGIRSGEYAGDARLAGARMGVDALTGAGNAEAAGRIGSTNAWSGALGGVRDTANMILLSRMLKPQPGGSAPGSSQETAMSVMPHYYDPRLLPGYRR